MTQPTRPPYALAVGAVALCLMVGASGEHTAAGVDGFRLVGAPIAVYGREAGEPIYFVFLRLNRAVPENPGRSPAAAVRLGGLGLAQPPTESSLGLLHGPRGGARHCYEQQLELGLSPPPRMRHPRVGRRLEVEVLIRGVRRPLLATVTLRRRALPPGRSERYWRALGCPAPAAGR